MTLQQGFERHTLHKTVFAQKYSYNEESDMGDNIFFFTAQQNNTETIRLIRKNPHAFVFMIVKCACAE